jgi:hypothetical protein
MDNYDFQNYNDEMVADGGYDSPSNTVREVEPAGGEEVSTQPQAELPGGETSN